MRRSGLNWWETVFFGLLLLIAGFILIRSPFFEVKTIEVYGNSLLPVDEIVSVAGLVAGTNIFQVHLGEAGERLQTLPLVKSTHLERRFPSTLVVTIEERIPLVLVNIEGAFWDVDEDGVVLRRQTASTEGLPVVTGAKPGSPEIDKALGVAASLPGDLKQQLSEINVSEGYRITLYTVDGILVQLGQAGRLELQGMILAEVLDTVRKSGKTVEYIDLAEPEKAVIKYRGE
ncbi:MAG: cell division protein FtsQ/DivIB [Eubacteriales bacterium]|nr:cell division protein FtsQ/DivIB [Bacillota bacterium]MBV1726975.1 cell division protein FtsQ/DivIB [Desulforudis sp.]MDQ7788776.1 cell division protein FtsQ/DivIB [Clostridia bacterium]MDZ4044016.1 cell division protein FtsQ/DivIB [Eubacteriales bacterium]MBU4534019.1 cell division protein FtsQ/DivIB [Bacillota bacterium]